MALRTLFLGVDERARLHERLRGPREAVGSYVDNTRGVDRIYFGVTAVEETLEIVGALIVTVAFLRMLRTTVVDGRRAVALRRG